MITIFRVQDSEGRGPYRPGTSHLWTDYDHERNPPFFHEFGWSVASIPYHWRVGETGGCGFRTQQQLRSWFSVKERARLCLRGYCTVQMDVDRIVAESDRQLVFARRRPLDQEILFLPWDTEVAA